MKLDIEDRIAATVLEWPKENGFEYDKPVWFKDGKRYSSEGLYNEFKIAING